MEEPVATGPAQAVPSAPAARAEPWAPAEAARQEGPRLRPPTPRVALLLVALLVLGVVLYLGRQVLGPFVVGLLVVYLLHPPIDRIARAGLPRWLAVLLVYVGVGFVIIEALSLMLRPLVDQVVTFVRQLPTLAVQLDQQLQRLSEYYRGLDLPPQLRNVIDQWLAELAETGAGIDPGVLLPVFNATAGLVAAVFGYILIPVWAFYLLKDRPALSSAFDRALPAEWRDDAWHVIRTVERVFGQWIRAQVVLGITVGVATFLGLMVLARLIDPVFGQFALLLAIVAGVLELLPIIGPIIASIPALLIAATLGIEAFAAVLLLYVLVQQVENNLLVPKIQGDAVKLHPSAVMFALVIGGSIFGLLGAILSLPVAAASRDVFSHLFRRLSPAPAAAPEVTAELADVSDASAPSAVQADPRETGPALRPDTAAPPALDPTPSGKP
jgi:predicted PurR-regulated permease PerM